MSIPKDFDAVRYLEFIKAELEKLNLDKKTVKFLVAHPFMISQKILSKVEQQMKTEPRDFGYPKFCGGRLKPPNQPVAGK